MNRLLTPHEAASVLGIKMSTLYSWVCGKKKKIPYVKLSSRLLRFRREDLEAFIVARSFQGGTDAPQSASSIRRVQKNTRIKCKDEVAVLVSDAKRYAGLL